MARVGGCVVDIRSGNNTRYMRAIGVLPALDNMTTTSSQLTRMIASVIWDEGNEWM